MMKTLWSIVAALSVVVLLAAWPLADSVGDTRIAVTDLDLLLKQRSYLELERALTSNPDLSPADRAFFEGVMANRRNRAAESITLLRPLIPVLSTSNKQRAVVALSTLADDYEKTFRYADAADSYAGLVRDFESDMSAEEIGKANREAARWNLLRTASAQTSTVNGPFTVETTRNRLGLVEAPVTIAGQRISMILDTGANLSAIGRSTARRLGLKLFPGWATSEGMTGDRIRVQAAIIPELEIGNATFWNVAVIVAEDQDMCVAPMQYMLPGSLGFPVLAALERITFFANGRFGVGSAPTFHEPIDSNLFLQRLTPIVAAAVGGKDELFSIDTGATGSFMSARYYVDHRREFEFQPLEELLLTGAGGTRSIPAFYAHRVTLSLGGACVLLDDVPVLIRKRSLDGYFYGNLGQSALRMFSSYTFDFQNMSFAIDGPHCGPSD
jgi:hypothetical protein